MKRRSMCAVIGMGLAIILGSCAERSTVTKQPVAESIMAKTGEVEPANAEFEGTIARVDAENGMITVDHWPLSKTFKVPADCQIDVLTNAHAAMVELKSGDAVVVTYSKIGKDDVASQITRKGKAYEEEQKKKWERLDEMLNPSPNQ